LSNIIKLIDAKNAKSTRAQIRDQANAFLARIDAGASAEDIQQIENWLAQSPLHREIFQDMAKLWDETTVLSALSEVFPLEQYSANTARKKYARNWAAAAALVLVAVSGWLVLDKTGIGANSDTAQEAVVYQHYVTEIGKQATVVLPDNSELILNTNTEIEVSFSASARNVFLKQGEAFFEVTKDPSRPFRVYAGKRMVEAVGTAFTVQHTEPDTVEVVVKEGKVNFLRLADIQYPKTLPDDVNDVLFRAESVSLAAGELAAAIADQLVSVEKQQIQPEEIEVKLAWTHGMLLFQGDSLEDVLKEMNRYTTTRIEADENIRAIRVEGYFKAGDIDGLLVAMQKNFHVEAVKVADDHIRLYEGSQESAGEVPVAQ
jgi:transmembrane sensor